MATANSTPPDQTTLAAIATGAAVGLGAIVLKLPVFGAIILGSGAAFITKKVIDAQGTPKGA
jgi:hypothetical protein